MGQLDLCSNLFKGTPAFSTTLILKPCCLTSCWYFLCSWDPGVAGTKMTDSSHALLYQSFFFSPFFFSRSSFLHSLGLCNGPSPFSSASCLAVYALRAESTTLYLNFLLYLELTGVMMWWDKELATRLQEMSIIQKMNKRYVDAMNMAIQATPAGLRYKNRQIFKDESAVEEDERISFKPLSQGSVTFCLGASMDSLLQALSKDGCHLLFVWPMSLSFHPGWKRNQSLCQPMLPSSAISFNSPKVSEASLLKQTTYWYHMP